MKCSNQIETAFFRSSKLLPFAARRRDVPNRGIQVGLMGFGRLFAQNTSDTQTYNTILLDGGLGTTLQDIFHKDISHPLWSARLIDEDEEIIVAAHLAFLRAGSNVILTSTYQAAYETFRRAKYADLDAEKLMRKSVTLAIEACKRYKLETTLHIHPIASNGPRPYIALSLGPYGATLETAAEFTGEYPPPYGPSLSSLGSLMGSAPASEEQSYEDALAAFHYSRLLVYAREWDIWNAIDIVAFETVPLVTEAKAIRRAVARLEDWFQETQQGGNNRVPQTQKMKPWYISFVFPGSHGEFPQHRCQKSPSEVLQSSLEARGEMLEVWTPYTPREVAQSAFLLQHDGSPKMATPNAIGINCTNIADIFQIMDGFIATVKDLLITSPKCFGDELPWLALLPNGGVAYDTTERMWVNAGPVEHAQSSEEWARSFGRRLSAQDLEHTDSPVWAGIFGGLLLGGCCKTGPNEIRALKETLTR